MKFPAIVPATLIAAAFFSTVSLSAQTQSAPPRPKASHAEHQQKRQDQVARDLNLTPEQKEKFAETDRRFDEKARANHSAHKEDMDKLRQERVQAHKALLNKEQSEKYDRMIAEKKVKHDAHKQNKGEKKQGKGKKASPTNPAPAPTEGSDKWRKN